MAGFKLELKGLPNVIKQFDPARITKNAELALDNFGLQVVKEAKILAPVDEGALVKSISYVQKGLEVEITVGVPYAAYIEFGTRRYAAQQVAGLPAEWKTFAAQFKGKGSSGSFDEFVQNIMAWVLRKGIGGLKTKSGNTSKSTSSYDAMQQAAYAIALNIIQNGIHAHPYLYPAVRDNTQKLKEDLSNL